VCPPPVIARVTPQRDTRAESPGQQDPRLPSTARQLQKIAEKSHLGRGKKKSFSVLQPIKTKFVNRTSATSSQDLPGLSFCSLQCKWSSTLCDSEDEPIERIDQDGVIPDPADLPAALSCQRPGRCRATPTDSAAASRYG
jgi:hypothetical protein